MCGHVWVLRVALPVPVVSVWGLRGAHKAVEVPVLPEVLEIPAGSTVQLAGIHRRDPVNHIKENCGSCATWFVVHRYGGVCHYRLAPAPSLVWCAALVPTYVGLCSGLVRRGVARVRASPLVGRGCALVNLEKGLVAVPSKARQAL